MIIVVLLFGIILAGTALSGVRAGSDQQQASSVESVEGIIAIKEGHGDILVRPDNGSDKRLRVRETTTITRNGKPATYNDLQARDRVQAKYHTSNREVIEIHATGS